MVCDWRGWCIQEQSLEPNILQTKTGLSSVGGHILHLIEANEDEKVVIQSACFLFGLMKESFKVSSFTTGYEGMRNVTIHPVVATIAEKRTLSVPAKLERAVFWGASPRERLFKIFGISSIHAVSCIKVAKDEYFESLVYNFLATSKSKCSSVSLMNVVKLRRIMYMTNFTKSLQVARDTTVWPKSPYYYISAPDAPRPCCR